MMRILCVSCLTENEKLVVASKNEEGEWIEHEEFELRSSFITSWMKAAEGNVYLARRGVNGLVSICSLKIPDSTGRFVVILLPDTAKKVYYANVINPEKLEFRKGMSLVTNYSKLPALVMLGKKRTEVMPGKQVTARAVAGKDGMYRMLVGYQDESKELIPCYDRYVSANPDARDFLLLFPDATTGLKVFSLSEFGPFE